MPVAPAVSPVVRAILTENINLSADEVIKKAKVRGVTAPEASIRNLAHNIKSQLRRDAAKAAALKPVPAAARATKTPEPEPEVTVASAVAAAPAPLSARSPSAPDLSAVLANVALVNAVVGASGGADTARQVAEAVQACGGVEAFLQHLDLVAGIRGGASA